MNEIELYDLAFNIAKEAHKDQKRWDGRSYFEQHCLPVSEMAPQIFQSFAPIWTMKKDAIRIIKIAGLLHDVVEDTDITLNYLLTAGIPRTAVDIIDLLTHRECESYTSYIIRISKGPKEAVSIKIADLNCNLADCIEKKHRQRKDKYELAKELLMRS